MESQQKCEHFIHCILIVIIRGKLLKCWSSSKIPKKLPVFGEKCFITNIYYSHNVIYIILFWSPNCPLQDNAIYFNVEHCLTYLQPSRPEQHNVALYVCFGLFVCKTNIPNTYLFSVRTNYYCVHRDWTLCDISNPFAAMESPQKGEHFIRWL